jgi:hypothetical protein
LDFYQIREKTNKDGSIEIYPNFKVVRTQDLMVRSKAVYAIWDEANNRWSQDEYDVQRLVDEDLRKHKEKVEKRNEGVVKVKYLSDFSSGIWLQFRNYVGHLSDSATQLDENLTFSNSDVKKTDYVSHRLPYALAPGDHSAWDEILDTLYSPEERAKIEWAIGAIVSGDSKKIQKFLVFYGAPGTGKGTVLDIIMKLFQGYYTTFEAKTLTGANNAFAMESFRSNPLVAIDPDGDLSGISDNTKLNAIVSHEPMTINEKFKQSYTARINAFLLAATNKAVKFTDAKSGLIRRMIDVHPTGNLLSPKKYQVLTSQVDFELGAIAQHCLDVYRSMGKDYYSGYQPIEMMLQTDVFFNFIEAYYDIFAEQNGVSLTQAHSLYKEFCAESELEFKMPKFKLREELKNYFDDFEDRAMVDGVRVRSWYSGFNADRFKVQVRKDDSVFALVMDETESIIDKEFEAMPAQYAKANGSGAPQKYWDNKPRQDPKTGEEFIPTPDQVVSTTLEVIDTSREHFVKVPVNHIVIDFDLKDADGNKSAERNLEAASKWPSTYAEYSKSEAGVHLHYNYDGDPSELSRVYDDGIEVKVFTGNSSLRRKLSKCNNIPVATLSTGSLPIQEKKVINQEAVKSEKSLRELIARNMRKEIHPGTKPSIDFIHKILEDAYNSGLPYDVSDLKSKLVAFANNSSNQAMYCIKRVMDMKFQSEVKPEDVPADPVKDDREVIYDVEVFPNLFVVCWSYDDPDAEVVKMINPTPAQIEDVLKLKLGGFNVRRYDNHIMYARLMGYDNEQLYQLSKRIINNVPNSLFGEAYNLSYFDIYDYASKKQGLKKWQIELGLKHDELGFDWDQPVPEEDWERVADYCANDVQTTKQVKKNREQDYVARKLLADISGLAVNDTTQKHTAKIIFGDDRRPQEHFIYTDLSEMFPGYKYEMGKSTYRGEVVGEGGYVDSDPGIWEDVSLEDVASMHPTSIIQLNAFGPYTKRFAELVEARLAIKRGDYEAAKSMLDGKLAPYLGSKEDAKALSYALKIIINIVYGLTSAKFDNPFRDPRNKDNIVAKRGALFMIDLKHYVEEQGYHVVHIKTDSIKVANADEKIRKLIHEFGKQYGYDFEHEYTYSKFGLVNDAVYVAKIGWAEDESLIGTWTATGAQFKEPYVFKTLFSKEPITFRDKCVEKHVQTALYLDFKADGSAAVLDDGEMRFVGKGGSFCPIKPGRGGALLMREKEGKFHYATGSKGWYWLESEMVETLGKEQDIDMDYFDTLVNEAIDTLGKFGDVEAFFD